jgi:hypothetical protein
VQAAAGFVGVHLLLAAAGGTLLYALGLVEARPRSLALAAGAAYFCGIALVFPLLVLLLVVGVPVTFATFVVVVTVAAGSLAAGGTVLRGRGRLGPPPPPPRPVRRRSLEWWAVRLSFGGIAVFFVGAAVAFYDLPTFWDDAHHWSSRALALYHYDHLLGDVFFNPALVVPSHLEYPLLQPLLESTLWRAMGQRALSLAHVELWIVFGSFIWTIAWLLAPGRRTITWLPALGALAIAGGTFSSIVLGNADVTVASLVAAGLLCVALWLESGRTPYVLLAGVLLGAAANTKNEGLAAAVVAVAVAGLVGFVVWRRRGLYAWAGSFGIALVGLLPWPLWVSDHGLRSRDIIPLRQSLDVGFLADRADRLNLGAKAVLGELVRQDQWHLFVPLFLVLAAICLYVRVGPRQIALYGLNFAGAVAALCWVYWNSAYGDVTQHIHDSVDRVVSIAVFVCAVAVAHLTTLLADRHAGPDEVSAEAGAAPATEARMAAPSGREPAART